ncbi:MAG: hypothetical protein ACI3YE_08795 [Candidatus Avispirillum sp.]
MDYRHVYKFANGGKPFTITVEENQYRKTVSYYDGNLSVYDESLLSVKFIEEKGFIFKKYYLAIKYLFGGFRNESVYEKTYPISSSEATKARQASEEATRMIRYLNDKKEEYSKEQDRKLAEARKTDTIDAIDVNGINIKIWRRETYFGDTVLFSEGGSVYHTHADCFENWKPMYKRQFKAWRLMKKADAEKQGLCECKLCEKYYEDNDDDGNLDFEC